MNSIERLQKGIFNMTHKSSMDYFNYMNTYHDTMTNDSVNRPKHYMLLPGVEVRDVISALTEKIELSEFKFTGRDFGDYVQMMQYLMRFMDKGGCEDLEKARWYLDKLIENNDAY